MSTQNQNPAPQAPAQRPEFLVYNTAGLRPVNVVFNIDAESFKDHIRKIADQKLSGIVDVTYQVDHDNGKVSWYAWLPANSDHFSDKSTANTVLGRSLPRYDNELVEFAKKFGWRPSDDDPQNGSDKVNLGAIIFKNHNEEIGQKLIAIQLGIIPFLGVMFDVTGESFKNTFHQNPPKVCIIRDYRWKSGPSGKYHTLLGVQISKTLSTIYSDYKKPIVKAGKFH